MHIRSRPDAFRDRLRRTRIGVWVPINGAREPVVMSEGVFVLADIFIGDTYDSQYYDAVVTQTDKERLKTRTQEWMSRPRESASSVVEILTYEFADRAPISSIAFDVLSVGA